MFFLDYVIYIILWDLLGKKLQSSSRVCNIVEIIVEDLKDKDEWNVNP